MSGGLDIEEIGTIDAEYSIQPCLHMASTE